jgi:phosphate acyltransferase
MGSESSPKALFEAVLEVAEQTDKSINFVVFVTHDIAAVLLNDFSKGALKNEPGSKIDFCFVKEFITMDDDPLSAVRLKKGSSLAVGIKHLGDRLIDAFVTSGNTGALIACATINLNPLGNFERSGLLAVLPTKDTSLAMVDVGGNIACKAAHLVQYALIGAAFQRCMCGVEVPKIGLLNIGVESKKGTAEVREAYRILQEHSSLPGSKISFVGNVEGREVFQGNIDVLVTDGFTGNVLLKTSEGLSSFIFGYMQQMMQNTPSEKLHKTLDHLQDHFSYEGYPGALVCGIDGIVIKCHGAATKKGMKNSLKGAITLVQNNLMDKIKKELSS